MIMYGLADVDIIAVAGRSKMHDVGVCIHGHTLTICVHEKHEYTTYSISDCNVLWRQEPRVGVDVKDFFIESDEYSDLAKETEEENICECAIREPDQFNPVDCPSKFCHKVSMLDE